MSQRKSTSVGVALSKRRPLTDDQTRCIKAELRASGTKAEPEFYVALEEALGHYDNQQEFREPTKPANVRENLTTAQQAAKDYKKALTNLDHNSLLLLGEVRPDDAPRIWSHVDDVVDLIEQLRRAGALAEKYPKGNQLKDYARLYLAVDIAAAIDDYTDTKSNQSDNGLFACLQSILIGSDSRPLRKRALDTQRIKHDSGMIEYRPPQN